MTNLFTPYTAGPLSMPNRIVMGPMTRSRATADHVPTEIEKNSDTVKLALIRETFGSRAQTLINALLAFDAYFAWYRPYKKSIPIDAPEWMAEERALENTRLAIDMQEIFQKEWLIAGMTCEIPPRATT